MCISGHFSDESIKAQPEDSDNAQQHHYHTLTYNFRLLLVKLFTMHPAAAECGLLWADVIWTGLRRDYKEGQCLGTG